MEVAAVSHREEQQTLPPRSKLSLPYPGPFIFSSSMAPRAGGVDLGHREGVHKLMKARPWNRRLGQEQKMQHYPGPLSVPMLGLLRLSGRLFGCLTVSSAGPKVLALSSPSLTEVSAYSHPDPALRALHLEVTCVMHFPWRPQHLHLPRSENYSDCPGARKAPLAGSTLNSCLP